MTSLRQQIIAGHPASRLSPNAQLIAKPRTGTGAGKLGEKQGERRSSATTISHRPPLPRPNISGRSQSLDGLLDDDGDVTVVGDNEGALDVVDGRGAGTETGKLEAQSLEVLLTEEPAELPKVQRPPRREERSKSVDNYLSDRPIDSIDSGRSLESLPRTRSPSEKFCESEMMIVDEAMEVPSSSSPGETQSVDISLNDDTAYNSEEEGPRIERQESTTSAGTTSAAMSRQNSTTSSELPERKKTFINRLGKRVKSLMKK